MEEGVSVSPVTDVLQWVVRETETLGSGPTHDGTSDDPPQFTTGPDTGRGGRWGWCVPGSESRVEGG